MEPFTLAIIGAGGYYLYKKLTQEKPDHRKNLKRNNFQEKTYKEDKQEIKYLSPKVEEGIRVKCKELKFYISKIRDGNSYLPITQQKFIDNKFYELNKIHINAQFKNNSTKNDFVLCKNFSKKYQKEIQESHLKYTHKQIAKYPNIFSRGKKNHTLSQSRSIISEENSTLVVAGAGSGKTSTIIGRIYYLVRVKLISPKNILVITYTKNAAEELKKRLSGIDGLEVRTIHSFGRKILLQSNSKEFSSKVSIDETLSDDKKFSSFIRSSLKRYTLKDNGKKFEKYFLSHMRPFKSILDKEIKSLNDYVEYAKNNGFFKTLNSEYVKSYEELEIANFLALNGVKYEYEKHYHINTVGQDEHGVWRGQYKPDFYLPEYNLYLEHYALDKDNRAPRWFEMGYYDGVKWKRALHKKFKTKCIESYSYERIEGKLLDNLAFKLSAEGVVFKKTDPLDLLSIFNESKEIYFFDKLVQAFITHFKSNELSIATLKQRTLTRGLFDIFRLNAFIDIFQHIYSEYQQKILKEKIDFIDMVIQSRKMVDSQKKYFDYQHVIIDEFQDISPVTLKLIKSLRKKTKTSQLFAVGDDWQSIYQFQGGDLKYFLNFDDYFGSYDQVKLAETFRFHQHLADFSAEFVMRNSNQLKKEIQSKIKPKIEINKPVKVYLSSKRYSSVFQKQNGLDKIFNDYYEQEKIDKEIGEILKINPKSTIFVIGRYNNEELSEYLEHEYPNGNVKYHTVHSSKGLEADFVIINNMRSGQKGFPSEMEDDPILKLVTDRPPQEGIQKPEERRLFYVALTRARYKVFIIADALLISSFINEISKSPYVSIVKDEKFELMDCYKCNAGKMILFQNSIDQSMFFSCQNQPICNNKFEYDSNIHQKYLDSMATPKNKMNNEQV